MLTKDENKKRVALIDEWIKNFSVEILINIFIFCLLLFRVPAHAEEHNWVYVGEIGSDIWLVDTNSISCRENICRTLVKIQSKASAKKFSIETEEYVKSLHEYNCTWLEYRILYATKYDSNGNVISSVSPTEPRRKYILPESISKTLYDLVCKKTSYQFEKAGKEEQKNAIGKVGAEQAKEAAKQFQEAPAPPKKIVPPREMQKDKKGTKKKFPRLQKPSGAVFTVQVGVFRNLSYAKSLKSMLNKKGYNVYVITSKSKKEEKLYTVWIGKFSDRKKAENLSEKIKKTEGLQAFVTLW
jgi:cell division septation protein DedD